MRYKRSFRRGGKRRGYGKFTYHWAQAFNGI